MTTDMQGQGIVRETDHTEFWGEVELSATEAFAGRFDGSESGRLAPSVRRLVQEVRAYAKLLKSALEVTTDPAVVSILTATTYPTEYTALSRGSAYVSHDAHTALEQRVADLEQRVADLEVAFAEIAGRVETLEDLENSLAGVTRTLPVFRRAQGTNLCRRCGKTYRQHMGAEEYKDNQGHRYLTRLCDGTLVKL